MKRPGQNYAELYEAIKRLGEWQHPLESTWMVKVSSVVSSNYLYTELRSKIQDDDLLFIVEITEQDHQGWLAKTFWEWMKK